MAFRKAELKEQLRKLTDAIGVSGHEQEIIKIIHEEISPYADEVRVSTIGSVVAIKRGAKPGPSVAVGAHMDEIGYVVRNILDSGFITLDKVGTAADALHVGRKVWITSNRIPGIIGTKPGHLVTPEEAKMVVPLGRCYVDVGCSSAEEVRALGIRIGDQAVIKSDFLEMNNPDLICTRAIDDRMGCAIILELFKSLKAEDFAGTLYGVFTVREEVGLAGAQNAIFDYDLDYIIALDTIPVADTPDYNPRNDLPMFLGKGPGFPVCESYGALNYQLVHPGIREFIEKTAAAKKIPLQTVTLAFAGYLTDATQFTRAKGGIPSATLAIPRRYSHSPVELVNINDADQLLELLKAMVEDNENANYQFVNL